MTSFHIDYLSTQFFRASKVDFWVSLLFKVIPFNSNQDMIFLYF